MFAGSYVRCFESKCKHWFYFYDFFPHTSLSLRVANLIIKAIVRLRRLLSSSVNTYDISLSEADGLIWPTFHLLHSWTWRLKVSVLYYFYLFFFFVFFMKNWFVSLVAIETKNFHKRIPGKIEKWHLLPSRGRYILTNLFAQNVS